MSYPAEILSDSPLGYWELDETSGSTAADSSGNGNTLTIGGGISLDQPPLITEGGCISVPGLANLSRSGSLLSGENDATIECWVDLDDVTDYATIIDFGGSGNGLSIQVEDGVVYGVHASGGSPIVVSSAVSTGTTYHVVLVLDTVNDTLTLFVNGSQVDQVADTENSASGTGDTGIGGTQQNTLRHDGTISSGAPTDEMDGRIDEVAVYGAALSSTRITAHYDEGVGASGTTLDPDDTSQSQTSETPALTQVHALSPSNTSQSQTAENPTLTTAADLTPEDTAQSQTAETPSATVVLSVAPEDTRQDQAHEFVEAAGGGNVPVAGGGSLVAAGGGPTLSVSEPLVPEDTAQSQSADTPTITQVHSLSAEDTSQSQTAENPSLSIQGQLAPESTSQSQTAETPTLSQTHSVTPEGTLQVQNGDAPTLSTSGPVEFGSGTPAAVAMVTGTPQAVAMITGEPVAA